MSFWGCFWGHDMESKEYPVTLWNRGEEDKKRNDVLFVDTCKRCGYKEAYTLTTHGRCFVDTEYVNRKMGRKISNEKAG